ncbi:MAG: hypothetical protein LUG16_04475 [Candidatus Gastranaerophilales bacterium]|nr:hypothetical protein [Candidatus Gastranaerophilales bacterium]
MTRNQLPEGVGKKIVEALKRQAEADITPVSEAEVSMNNALPLTDIQEIADVKPQEEETTTVTENIIIEEEPAPSVVYSPQQEEIPLPVKEEKQVSFVTKPAFVNENINTMQQNISETASNIRIPANVTTLKNLIAGLPAGVTKQTGAQIIKQTLEAMGIPMNSVLKEAQDVQEELNSSTRECMLKIQEYKTNILQLEQSVQEYQKNITQINDLVSLFLLTDK